MRAERFPDLHYIDDPKLKQAFNDLARVLRPIVENPLGQVNLVTDVELPGVRGRVASVSGPVLTLGRGPDARMFKVGDVVHVAAFPGGDGLDELRSGSVRLTAINPGQRTLTASVDWVSAIPDIAKGDWLCIAEGGRPEYGERSTIDVAHGLPGAITGFFIVNARDRVPAVRRLPVPNAAAFNREYVRLASVYACTVDILFF